MQDPNEFVKPQETETQLGSAQNPRPAAPLIYDLRRPHRDSQTFFDDASRFADRVLELIDARAGSAVSGYARFVQSELMEPPRSQHEYALEFLTLGLLLSRYAGAAERTPAWTVDLLHELVWLRSRSPRLKPLVDLVRTILTRLWVMPYIGRPPASSRQSLHRLPVLIEWLHATGEFEQEAMRLNNWRRFLDTLPPDNALRLTRIAIVLLECFRVSAEAELGSYTEGVQAFLEGDYAKRCHGLSGWLVGREDQILCGRAPVEYHLNMIVAEVMNRALRSGFERTPRKVVLVPACMRGTHASTCRARATGLDIVCTACDPECTVNRITRDMRRLGAKVYIVPHASGFSRWLDRWQRAPDVGVVAVACLLHILPGGLEMRLRGIPSQCVPLDYPGCRKHWTAHGISTGVNEDRLAQLVQISAQPAS